MRTGRPSLALLWLVALTAACDVYDSSLLVGGAGEGGVPSTGGNPTTGGSTGEGGMAACETADQCPGMDNECGTRTCDGGLCGVDAVAAGTPATDQMAGDCIVFQCDGAGHIVGNPDDSDLPVDNLDCTDDLCDGGVPSNPLVGEGLACNDGGGSFCNADGACVECIDDFDCASNVCTDEFECAPASCDDNVQNNGETDIDCGGLQCSGCAIGFDCVVNTDCLSMLCGAADTCVPSCVDGVQNQNETDVDCGGSCPDCTFGQGCVAGSDCDTGTCGGNDTCTCAPVNGVLIISEVRTRGPMGATDDFVELFNPGTANVTFGATWTIESRAEGSASYTVRYTGEGQVVPPNEHLLLVGSTYSGATAADDVMGSSFADESSIVVKNNGAVVDAVCWNCGANTYGTHTCEGTVFTVSGCANNVDRSAERLPGGALGNCIDTGDNAADFVEITPSLPQNLNSPPTP
ncbi:MAG: lamin tail domain-containing protein [Polyangiaceae bacterium]|nr:lamin tail domain-containing protein [Polyangiaceae bacterium]MBK8939321.1 lamin tail domain-containing protein [Polyangiaceae bacterium]